MEGSKKMSDWKPNLYLTFGKERTQPAIDLMMRVEHQNPARIVDIGCGPGNSTSVLKARWPSSEIIGVDNSQAMIEQAKETYESMTWICADASNDLSELGKFDIVFSNAAIQWIPNHEALLSNLFNLLNKNGAMAIQVPNTSNMPIHIDLKNLTASDKWNKQFNFLSNTYSCHTEYFYYDILCGLTEHIDMWVTDYCHVMDSHHDLVKWYSSTGLRPYLGCLKDENLQNEFLGEYEELLNQSYPVQKNGKILFPFTRIFFIAKNV